VLAINGGSGLARLQGLEILEERMVETPYGPPSGPLVHGRLEGVPVVFLARHGPRHTIPPHRINYRANIWALREHAGDTVLAVAAVGGIATDPPPGGLCVPDQIIDYTWGRAHTFHDDFSDGIAHVDFTRPYCERLRQRILEAARAERIPVRPDGTYAAVQGPRLESAAEIDRFERDGCHIIGMTGMPEAGLAREAGLCYATLAVCANPAAGRGPEAITLEQIDVVLSEGMDKVRRVLIRLLASSLGAR
jgi:5'-deoxy-5'-methylthioadenosine phosphorylase